MIDVGEVDALLGLVSVSEGHSVGIQHNHGGVDVVQKDHIIVALEHPVLVGDSTQCVLHGACFCFSDRLCRDGDGKWLRAKGCAKWRVNGFTDGFTNGRTKYRSLHSKAIRYQLVRRSDLLPLKQTDSATALSCSTS